jgi:hypothetical protein
MPTAKLSLRARPSVDGLRLRAVNFRQERCLPCSKLSAT